MRTVTQAVVAAAVVGVVAGGSSAFTAQNTVAATAVGQGATATTGFAVSGVTYTLDTAAASGDRVLSVAFTLTHAAGVHPTLVKARAVAGTAYVTCTPTNGAATVTTAVCTLGTAGPAGSGPTAAQVDTLDVVAVA